MMDSKCYCTEASDIPSDEKIKKPDQVQKPLTPTGFTYYTNLDFGLVPVKNKVTKTVYIKNDTNLIQMYAVSRTFDSNLLYNVFNCNIMREGNIKPNEIFQCKITFKPVVPGEKSFYKFEIVDNSYNRHIINVKGESVAPSLRVSAKFLDFFLTKNSNCMKRQIFEIRNTSSCVDISYQCELESRIFKIDKRQGTIVMGGKCFITVVFKPKDEGTYSERLWCLFKNHEPVLIELFGIYHPNMELDLNTVLVKRYPFAVLYRTGISGYLELPQQGDSPPVALNKTCLYFDDAFSLTTSMRNNINYSIRVEWLKSKQNVFQISPKVVIIPPGAAFTLSCKFYPKAQNRIYSEILTAQIYWHEEASRKGLDASNINIINNENNVVHVPLLLTLKCAAHTFQPDYSRIALLEAIPNYIFLPPCTSFSTSFGTFIIKSNCRLPTLYRIIPPNKTFISMKPMVGVIQPGEFQIVSMQFIPQAETFFAKEEWKISINGQADRLVPIVIRAQCNIPTFIIGDNNIIRFPVVQVGWKEFLWVYMKNTSIFEVKYALIIPYNDYVEIEPKEGYIGANEERYFKMTYTGHLCAPNKSKLICKCQAVQRQQLIGKEYIITAIVYTKCVHSQLCALPKSEDLGEVKWRTPLQVTFYAYNFGTPPIHFSLKSNDPAAEINPLSGTIESGEKVQITVIFTAETIGDNKLTVSYEVPNSTEEAIEVFTAHFSCVHPVIQIDEIIDHNLGQLFSKSLLWDLLNVEPLNEILKNIVHGERKEIVCYVPDFEISTALHFVSFLVSNQSNFLMNIALQRVQMCQCKAAETKSLSFRKKVYSCPHRDMLTMKVSTTEIAPKGKGILTFELKYIEPDRNHLRYLLTLTDHRIVEITILMYSIKPEVSTLSAYKPLCNLEFQDVFIGDACPPLQSFWVYNNSAHSVTYHVDTVELTKLNNKEGVEVLRCLNPVDMVEAYNFRPIVFRFRPIEAKQHKITIPLLLGDKVLDLNITGNGSEEYTGVYKKNSMPSFSKTPVESVVVSIDDMTIKNISLWSCTEKIIFLRNNSKERTYEYEWTDYMIEGVLKIITSPKEGYIKPRELLRIYVRLYSYGEACITHVVLSCKLLDHTQLLLHEQSKVTFGQKAEELSQYFTITEKGMIYPKVDTEIKPPPEFGYVTVGFNVEVTNMAESHSQSDMGDLLKGRPHSMIETDVHTIMQEYERSLTKIDPPIVESLEQKEMDHASTENKSDKDDKDSKEEPLDEDLGEIIADTITLLIGEVVFSDTLKSVIEAEENDFSNYYCQYQLEPGLSTSQEPSKRVKLSQQRARETERFLNYPQAQELGCTIKSLLNDSVDDLIHMRKAFHVRFTGDTSEDCSQKSSSKIYFKE